jgi:cytosine/creatinine deaminase
VTVIDNIRLATDPEKPVAIVCADGRIAAIDAPGTHPDAIDGAGALALPGLVDAHAHVDKTLFGGPWVPNPGAESVAERIAHERRQRDAHGLPNEDHIAALVERMIAQGTTHVRTHTDVDPGVGLRGVEAVARVAERYRHAVTIEQVAFPQGGLLSNPGTLELLEESVELGVTTIGGLDPALIDHAPAEHLDAVFDLAARTGSRIDIHLHEDGTLGAWEFGEIIARTRSHGLADRVAISHAFAIAHAPHRLAEGLAEAGVALVTAAVYDVPVPPLDVLAAAGVPLAAGSDGIRDLWGPYGNGDMLQRAMHVGYRNSVRTDEGLRLALRAATDGAAEVLGLPDYGLSVGCAADLVLVDARHAAEAVVAVPPRRLVVKAGRVVAADGVYTG